RGSSTTRGEANALDTGARHLRIDSHGQDDLPLRWRRDHRRGARRLRCSTSGHLPTAASGLTPGTLMRPDGKTQVTFDGKPLYRFAEDNSPKSVSGHGVSDNFGGKSFTWHVASPGKTTASTGGGRYSSGY